MSYYVLQANGGNKYNGQMIVPDHTHLALKKERLAALGMKPDGSHYMLAGGGNTVKHEDTD